MLAGERGIRSAPITGRESELPRLTHRQPLGVRLVGPPAAGEVVARVPVNDQHLVGQLVDHQQVRGIGVLLARSCVSDLAITDLAVGRPAVTGLEVRLSRHRAAVSLLHRGHRPGHTRLPAQHRLVWLVGQEIRLILRGVLAAQPGPAPPPEDHRRGYGAERYRSPSQTNMASAERGDEQPHCRDQQHPSDQHAGRVSYQLRHARRTRTLQSPGCAPRPPARPIHAHQAPGAATPGRSSIECGTHARRYEVHRSSSPG